MSAPPTPDLSPVQSPLARPRRLSSRRGSVAAADPWGAHNDVNMNPARSLTSRLTIVRVPQAEVEDPPRRHRRVGSNASLNSNSSGKDGGAPGRMSFAFTSFTPAGQQSAAPGRPASPSRSPLLRPSSPGTSRFHGGVPGHSRLTPEQVVDLARTSVNPRSPLPSPHGPLSGAAAPHSPVSFTPLPDSIYVPFIDRPVEVTALLQAQPNARLFALLQQTFPLTARASMGAQYDPAKAPRDSKEWTFADLEHWLKKVDREDADDVLWVRKVRRCLMAHSELIWERMKGALGVPPELDVEKDDASEHPVHRDPPLTAASLDSNVFEPDSPVTSLRTMSDSEEITIEPVFANQSPPPSVVDASGMHSSLGDLREEDESEAAQEQKEEAEQEVHGIRFMTSPSNPTCDAALSVSPVPPLGSPLVQSKFGAPEGADDKDQPYVVLRERGPGHPLFPSNFAQLSLSPTLRSR